MLRRTLFAFAAAALVMGVGAKAANAEGHKKDHGKADKCQEVEPSEKLRFVTLAPAGSQWATELQRWARNVNEESECKLYVQWFWNGGGGGEDQAARSLRLGQKDGAAMTAVGLSEFVKDILILQLPGVFANWGELDAARNNPDNKSYYDKKFRDAGIVLLGTGDVGAAKIMTTGDEPVKVPGDLKKQGVSALPGDPIMPMFFAKVGGLTYGTVSVPEIAGKLGTTITVLTTPPYAADQLQWSGKVKSITEFTTAFGIGGLVIRKAKLEELKGKNAKFEEVLLKTGDEGGRRLTNTIRQLDAAAYDRLRKSKTAVQLSEDEKNKWRDVFRATRQALRGAPFTPEVFDRITKGK